MMNMTEDYDYAHDLEMFIANESWIENPMNDVTQQEVTTYEHEASSFSIWTIIMIVLIIKLLLVLWGIIVNIFLVCLLCVVRRLRTRTYVYVIHFVLMYSLYMICELLAGVLFIFFCVSFELRSTAVELCFVFVEMMMIDYVIVDCCPNFLKKYEKIYKWIIAVIYGIFAVRTFIDSGICMSAFRHVVSGIPVKVIYFIDLFTVSALCILKIKKSPSVEAQKISYVFVLSLTILLLWLPHVGFHTFETICYVYLGSTFGEMLQLVMFVMEYVLSLLPTFVVIILYKKDKNFQMALMRLFKRSLRKYRDENIDDEPISECFNDKVTFHTGSTISLA